MPEQTLDNAAFDPRPAIPEQAVERNERVARVLDGLAAAIRDDECPVQFSPLLMEARKLLSRELAPVPQSLVGVQRPEDVARQPLSEPRPEYLKHRKKTEGLGLHTGQPQEGLGECGLETIQTLLDLLNPLHGSLDEQTYDEKLKQNFDAPRDAEYAVNVTAQQERDLTQAVLILEDRKRAAKSRPAATEGWQLVPKEPSNEMLAAARHVRDTTHADLNSGATYRAMLAAAPPPPVAENGWQPMDTADKSIAVVHDLGEITIRHSYPIWARVNGEPCEVVWSDKGYWWDLDGEDQVEPDAWWPHPLAPPHIAAVKS